MYTKETLPKKFIVKIVNSDHPNCNVSIEGDDVKMSWNSGDEWDNEYNNGYSISDMIGYINEGWWVITTIFDDEYESGPDNSVSNNPVSNNSVSKNPSFDDCYINVAGFAKKHNISLETAHYLIQPWLFSMGHSWGIFMGKSVVHIDKEFLVFEEGRICWELGEYLEERDELCLNYSPVSGITYVTVPFVKPKTKRTGWVNVYSFIDNSSVGCIYSTKEEAIKRSSGVGNHVDTVEISWEE